MNPLSSYSDLSIHFSDIQNIKIYDQDNTFIGTSKDLFVNYEEAFPTILAIQFKNKTSIGYITWESIESFSLKKIVISKKHNIFYNQNFPKLNDKQVVTSLLAQQFQGESVEFPPLGKVVLDRQVVDTSGKKVIRVNDLEFMKSGQHFKLTHALVGLRSLFRRIGLIKIVDFFVFKIGLANRKLKKKSR